MYFLSTLKTEQKDENVVYIFPGIYDRKATVKLSRKRDVTKERNCNIVFSDLAIMRDIF